MSTVVAQSPFLCSNGFVAPHPGVQKLEMTMATYTITKIKTFNGREGQGLNATICKDGKAICFVMDDASGGEVDYDYRNPLQNAKSFQSTTKEMADDEEFALGEYCLSLLTVEERAESEKDCKEMKEKWAPELDISMKMREDAVESWVNNFIDSYENKKRLDRVAKKKTLFRIEGDSKEEFRTLKIPYTDPRAKEFLDKKYGAKIIQVWGVQL